MDSKLVNLLSIAMSFAVLSCMTFAISLYYNYENTTKSESEGQTMKKCLLCNSPVLRKQRKEGKSRYKEHVRNWGANNLEYSFMVEKQTEETDYCYYHTKARRREKRDGY